MTNGWKKLEAYAQRIPPGRVPSRSGQTSQFGAWYYTGEVECPDCLYRTHEDDLAGIHNCPTTYDSQDQEMHIGDKIIFYANDQIIRGELTKFNKKTGNFSCTVPNPEKYGRAIFTVGRKGKMLRDDS